MNLNLFLYSRPKGVYFLEFVSIEFVVFFSFFLDWTPCYHGLSSEVMIVIMVPSFYFLLLIFIAFCFGQVKRCAEMSRKLRFFKDQVNKAGLMSSSRTLLQPDIDLEDLEVSFCFFFSVIHDCCLRVNIQVTCCLAVNNYLIPYLKLALITQKFISLFEHFQFWIWHYMFCWVSLVSGTSCWAWTWANWNELQ